MTLRSRRDARSDKSVYYVIALAPQSADPAHRVARGTRNEEGFRPEAAFTAAKCLAFLFPPGPFLLAQRVSGKRRRGDVVPADARQEE
jgi:hypothetical protein